MTTTGPSYDAQNLRLAYEQQVENVREGKRLQWQVTYLGIVALAALASAYQLLREWNPSGTSAAARVFTTLGGGLVFGVGWVIVKAMLALRAHRKALAQIAEKLDDPSHPYLKDLIGIPSRGYGSGVDVEPILLLLVLVAGASVLGWMLLGAQTAPPPGQPLMPLSLLASATWWPLSPEAVAAFAATIVAAIALGKQYRDEHNRRKAVEARMSAVAYTLYHQLETWITEAPKSPSHPDERNAFEAMRLNPELATADDPHLTDREGYMRIARPAVAWISNREQGHYKEAGDRIERLVSDAPEANEGMRRPVRRAYVLFRRATRRWSHEATIETPRFKELIGGYDDLRACLRLLNEVVGPDLREAEHALP